MKNRVLILLIVIAMLAISGLTTAAAAGSADLKALTTGPVTLYDAPSESAEVVAELAPYTTVAVLASDASGQWLEVEAAEGTGFVMADGVIILNLPLLAPKVIVSTARTGSVGLYAEPDFGAEITAMLPDGTVASVLGTDGEWTYLMTGDGQTGWAVASGWAPAADDLQSAFIVLDGTDQIGIFAEADIFADVIGTLTAGDAVTFFGVEGDWAQVITADNTTGFVNVDYLSPVPNVMVDAASGSDSNAAVYAEADFGAEILASLDDGTPVTLMSQVDDFWVEIYHPSFGMGYGLADNFGPAYTTATVQVQNAVVRAGPNDNLYNAIGFLPAGTEVVVKGTNDAGGWIAVSVPFDELEYPFNGVNGWMRDFLFEDAVGNSDLDVSLLSAVE